MPQQESQPSDDRPADAGQIEGAAETHDAKQTPTESLLRQVLDETITDDAKPLAAEELEALRDVVQRHQHEGFHVEPVGVALVESILTLRLPEYQATEQQWHDMSQQIATAFFEAPVAHARLKQLWDRLLASTS